MVQIWSVYDIKYRKGNDKTDILFAKERIIII